MSIAEKLGGFAKWTAILAIFLLSLTLSLGFFTTIAPPDKPWFPIAGLSLTEGGFLLWMAVFKLTRHDVTGKAIALVMTVASAICCLSVAGYELYGLLATHFDFSQNGQMAEFVSILLEIIFAMHFSAFIIDLFASYFAVPGHEFHGHPRDSYEDVRTSPPLALPQQAESRESVTPVTPREVTPVTKVSAKKEKGWVGRYLSGQPLSTHGRDCICSSCRPDMHA